MTTPTLDDRSACSAEWPSCWGRSGYRLLKLLSLQVPVVEASQAEALIGERPQPTGVLNHQLETLRAGEWLQRYTLEIAVPQVGAKPVYCWMPGDSKPQLNQLRSICRRPQSQFNYRRGQIFVATRQTLNLFGGDALAHRSHGDLERLAFWTELSVRISENVGSDCLRLRGEGTPQAIGDLPTHLFLQRDSCPPTLSLLLQCSSRRGLQKVHEYCLRRSFHYEIW